jgi:hypothetical protein
VSLSPDARHGAESLSQQAKRGVRPIARPERRKPAERKPLRVVSEKRAASGEPIGLKRTELAKGTSKLKKGPLGRTTDAQKARVAELACIGCSGFAGECDPAHVIDRNDIPDPVADDVRAVVPLCRACHDLYDERKLDLSRALEPVWRDSWEWAVGAVGFFRALRRITNKRWSPVSEPVSA